MQNISGTGEKAVLKILGNENAGEQDSLFRAAEAHMTNATPTVHTQKSQHLEGECQGLMSTRETHSAEMSVPATAYMLIVPKFLKKSFFFRVKPAAKTMGGRRP